MRSAPLFSLVVLQYFDSHSFLLLSSLFKIYLLSKCIIIYWFDTPLLVRCLHSLFVNPFNTHWCFDNLNHKKSINKIIKEFVASARRRVPVHEHIRGYTYNIHLYTYMHVRGRQGVSIVRGGGAVCCFDISCLQGHIVNEVLHLHNLDVITMSRKILLYN